MARRSITPLALVFLTCGLERAEASDTRTATATATTTAAPPARRMETGVTRRGIHSVAPSQDQPEVVQIDEEPDANKMERLKECRILCEQSYSKTCVQDCFEAPIVRFEMKRRRRWHTLGSEKNNPFLRPIALPGMPFDSAFMTTDVGILTHGRLATAAGESAVQVVRLAQAIPFSIRLPTLSGDDIVDVRWPDWELFFSTGFDGQGGVSGDGIVIAGAGITGFIRAGLGFKIFGYGPEANSAWSPRFSVGYEAGPHANVQPVIYSLTKDPVQILRSGSPGTEIGRRIVGNSDALAFSVSSNHATVLDEVTQLQASFRWDFVYSRAVTWIELSTSETAGQQLLSFWRHGPAGNFAFTRFFYHRAGFDAAWQPQLGVSYHANNIVEPNLETGDRTLEITAAPLTFLTTWETGLTLALSIGYAVSHSSIVDYYGNSSDQTFHGPFVQLAADHVWSSLPDVELPSEPDLVSRDDRRQWR